MHAVQRIGDIKSRCLANCITITSGYRFQHTLASRVGYVPWHTRQFSSIHALHPLGSMARSLSSPPPSAARQPSS